MQLQTAKKGWQPLKSYNPNDPNSKPDPNRPFSAQELFLKFSMGDENHVDVLVLQGGRGTGKSAIAVALFMMHVGKGYGSLWQGLILRVQFGALKDVFKKAQEIAASYWTEDIDYKVLSSAEQYCIKWKTGETLYFRHLSNEDEFENKFKGQEFPFILFEELTGWPDMKLFDKMRTCCRAPKTPDGKTVPKMMRATTNPDGPGHSVVKERIIKASLPGQFLEFKDPHPFKKREFLTRSQMHLHTNLTENYELDDDYINQILAMKETDPATYRMWMYGDWDVVKGGVFSEVLDKDTQVMKPFKIPRHWIVKRAFDYGSSDPFCGLWYAIVRGNEPINVGGGKFIQFPHGSIIILKEYYGAKAINQPKKRLSINIEDLVDNYCKIEEGLKGYIIDKNHEIKDGPADYFMFNGKRVGLKTPGDFFAEKGKTFSRGIKKDQSIEMGISLMKRDFNNARKRSPDAPWLIIFDHCKFTIETIWNLQCDDNNTDRPAKGQPDHACDVIRYIQLEKEINPTQAYDF